MGIRGVAGEVDATNEEILDLLSLFEGDRFHVRWIDEITSDDSSDELVSFSEVRERLREGRPSELDIRIYPPKVQKPQLIRHYGEFPDPCKCWFRMYDSRYYDISVRDGTLLQKLYDKLVALGAENLTFKTEEGDNGSR